MRSSVSRPGSCGGVSCERPATARLLATASTGRAQIRHRSALYSVLRLRPSCRSDRRVVSVDRPHRTARRDVRRRFESIASRAGRTRRPWRAEPRGAGEEPPGGQDDLTDPVVGRSFKNTPTRRASSPQHMRCQRRTRLIRPPGPRAGHRLPRRRLPRPETSDLPGLLTKQLHRDRVRPPTVFAKEVATLSRLASPAGTSRAPSGTPTSGRSTSTAPTVPRSAERSSAHRFSSAHGVRCLATAPGWWCPAGSADRSAETTPLASARRRAGSRGTGR